MKENVYEMRKQIADQLQVPAWSFIISILEKEEIEQFLCRNRSVGDFGEEGGRIFCFEISPEALKDQDTSILDKFEDEFKSGHVHLTIDDDENNGISRDWVKVPLIYTKKMKSKYSYYERKDDFSFDRVIWLNTSWDFKRIHLEIFKYLDFYLTEGQLENKSHEQGFGDIFEHLPLDDQSSYWGHGDEEGDAPYTVQFINPNQRKYYYAPPCPFCNEKKCSSCPLEFSNEKVVLNCLEQFFKPQPKKKKTKQFSYMNMESSEESDEQPPEETEEMKSGIYKNDGFYLNEDHNGCKKQVFKLEVFFKKDDQFNLEKHARCKKNEKYEEDDDKTSNSQNPDLMTCFDSFNQVEILSQENQWYCKECKEHVQAKKQMQIYKAPPVLFLNLKRFKTSSGSYYKDKLEQTVVFPLTDLDLSDYILSNRDENGKVMKEIKYELYAVSNHFGGMGFGNYTAFAKNPKTNNWYDFDDSSVTQVDEDSVITDAAYNLFYIRSDLVGNEDQIHFDSFRNEVDTDKFIELMNQIREKEEEEDKKKNPEEKMETDSPP